MEKTFSFKKKVSYGENLISVTVEINGCPIDGNKKIEHLIDEAYAEIMKSLFPKPDKV